MATSTAGGAATLPGGATRTRVLIVDDSALVRQVLTEMLSSDPEIEVVGTAPDPYVARERIKRLNPDVLTLDVEMPRMDGLRFLRNLMRLRPMPVVMVSSLTERGADVTLEALDLGAVDFVTKPKVDLVHGLEQYRDEICAKVKAARGARLRELAWAEPQAKLSADAVIARGGAPRPFRGTDRVLAIGASTGGTEAIRELLTALPPDAPGTVIAQHIPPVFSASFATRLDALCAMRVCEASDGQQVMRGHAYVAPGDRHLLLARDGARYVCRLSDGPPVNRHKPSVDVLFRSVAQSAGGNAIGVILTGMGDDGARGLLEMREAGAPTIAQDEASSVVWGMPGAAVKHGAADEVLALAAIAPAILERLR